MEELSVEEKAKRYDETIPRPDTGITEFESKLVDFLFKATKTEEQAYRAAGGMR